MSTALFRLQSRRLTVGTKAFIRANHKYVFFPEIVLQGKWLEESGFHTGQVVQITCEGEGKLVITLAGAEQLAVRTKVDNILCCPSTSSGGVPALNGR